jgi:hypothetical protein
MYQNNKNNKNINERKKKSILLRETVIWINLFVN